MKVVLAGAFGALGFDILKKLITDGYEVVALDLKERDNDFKGKYKFYPIDVTKKDTLDNVCNGADIVITTVGLVGASTTLTNYDVDLNGNLNLLNEAIKANVKKFIYVSVIKCDKDSSVPMLDSKYKFENKLKESGIDYVILRPTGYFYDIAKVFMPMVNKGKVTLVGRKDYKCNVIDTSDLADFIINHINDTNKTYEIGGTEVYSYKEIANMFFKASGKKTKISRAPIFLFNMIIRSAKKKNNGKEAIVRFSKWTLTNDMVSEIKYGKLSFKEYVNKCYERNDK